MQACSLVFSLLLLAAMTSPSFAAGPGKPLLGMVSPEAMQEMQKLNPTSVFAFPGQACPVGSEAYKGPEGVADSGVVYCAFFKKAMIYPKKHFEACPAGMRLYKTDKAKPTADVLWCEPDPEQKKMMMNPSGPPSPPPAAPPVPPKPPARSGA